MLEGLDEDVPAPSLQKGTLQLPGKWEWLGRVDGWVGGCVDSPCSWRGWLGVVVLPGGAEPGCSWLVPRGHAAILPVPQPRGCSSQPITDVLCSLAAAPSLQQSQDPGLGACRGNMGFVARDGGCQQRG